MPHDATFPIDSLLEQLGFRRVASKQHARNALIEARLTNATKQNMAEAKREAAVAAIAERIAPVCSAHACRAALDARGRPVVEVEPAGCEVCGGSGITRATRGMVTALVGANRPRLLVIGGSPNARTTLRDAVAGTPVAISFIEGDRPTGAKRARELADAADVIVIWANTQLDHKVSQPFATAAPAKTVTCARRGVAALADEVARHVARHGGSGGTRQAAASSTSRSG